MLQILNDLFATEIKISVEEFQSWLLQSTGVLKVIHLIIGNIFKLVF